jgi:hypothetical protein
VTSSRISTLILLLLGATAAAPARAVADAGAAAIVAGRGCLTPEDPPGTAARAPVAGEATAATCGRRGWCDEPGIRDGTTRRAINLRVVAHVLRSSDGLCSFSAAQVRAVVDEMNADLRANAAGIQLDLQAVRERVDDQFAWVPVCEDAGCNEARRRIYLAREMYAEAPEAQLTLYFSCQRNSRDGGLAGVGAFPWYASPPNASMGLWLNVRSIESGTAHLGTHELGHVLGLLHTHRGVSEVSGCGAGCAENVNTPDADVRGDFAADTPPTPENTTCSPPGGEDCQGVPWGRTQPENHMGYGPGSCVSRFTANQVQRMQCWTQMQLSPWYSTPPAPCRRAADAATVALWHFDETGGTALAEDLGGAAGALLGPAARGQSHCGSPCLVFSNSADGARLPGVGFDLPRGSVSCSFRWTGGLGGWLFDRERTGATADLGAFLGADGRIRFHVGGAERVVSARAVETGRWYRLTCSWDGAAARIEIDDAPDAAAPTTAIPAAGAGALIVGSAGLAPPAGGGFVGEIDEVALRRAPAGNPPFPSPDLAPVLRLSAIPNPFRTFTSIAFVLPAAGPARLQVVDLLGRRVATLVDGALPAGPHRFDWDGRRAGGEAAPPGIYVLRLAAGGGTRAIRVARVP